MIIVSVVLMSARDGSSTELARMGIDNIGGDQVRRDYRCQTYRGRSTEALNRFCAQREGRVLGHESERVHVWNLVAKALASMGYGDRPPAELGGGQLEIMPLSADANDGRSEP